MTIKSNLDYPYEGQLFPAQIVKHEVTIVFVHFFEGNKKKLLRHIRLVNQLGYNAFAFNLYNQANSSIIDLSSEMKFGLKHIFADQLTHVLNLLPGKKIIFSFSNPSAAAIESIALRTAHDVVALICDSGPSLRFKTSAWNLARYEKKFNPVKALFYSQFLSYWWSPLCHKDVPQHLSAFPKDFPILLIQAEEDVLIPPIHIDDAFANQRHLKISKKLFLKCGHLLALKTYPEEYKKIINQFLTKYVNKESNA